MRHSRFIPHHIYSPLITHSEPPACVIRCGDKIFCLFTVCLLSTQTGAKNSAQKTHAMTFGMTKNITQFNDVELIETTKQLVYEERLKTLEVLAHLQEIYDRRLHLKRSFASLHEFLVKELSYSDGAAHRRISAMRLVRELPETKAMVASGTLSLTTAATVQNFFRAEARSSNRINSNPSDQKQSFSREAKLELVQSLSGVSRQACEKKLAALLPETARKHSTLTLECDDELKELLDEYRKLAMVRDGAPSTIIKAALKTAIKALKARQSRVSPHKSGQRIAWPQKHDEPAASPEKLKSPSIPSRYVAMADRKKVWQRDQGRCSFIDPTSRRQCTATRNLEIDHIVPFVFEGPSRAENLRLLCRAHNQLRAIIEFGVKASPEKLGRGARLTDSR